MVPALGNATATPATTTETGEVIAPGVAVKTTATVTAPQPMPQSAPPTDAQPTQSAATSSTATESTEPTIRSTSAIKLAQIAEGTRGSFVHNTNNLYDGLQNLMTPPECIYLIGFSPKDLKHDGRFHPITVKVDTKQKLTVQARRGYVARK